MLERAVVEIIKIALRSGIRGRTRLTMFLAGKFPELQSYPVRLSEGEQLFLDLRLVGTHDLLIGKSIEVAERNVMQAILKPGDVAYDIGAHIGFHTIHLSKLVGPGGTVIAFEPHPLLLPVLRKTLSELSNVKLFETALSNKSGSIQFYEAREASMSGFSDWGCGGIAVEVHAETLDHLFQRQKLPTPDFIKCDIEGAEVFCFEGAAEMLEVACPIILFEANMLAASSLGRSASDAIDFLRELKNPRYCFFEVEGDGLKEFSADETIFSVHNGYSNILALPAKRYPKVELGKMIRMINDSLHEGH